MKKALLFIPNRIKAWALLCIKNFKQLPWSIRQGRFYYSNQFWDVIVTVIFLLIFHMDQNPILLGAFLSSLFRIRRFY